MQSSKSRNRNIKYPFSNIVIDLISVIWCNRARLIQLVAETYTLALEGICICQFIYQCLYNIRSETYVNTVQ